MPTAESVVRAALGDLAVESERLIDGLAWLNNRYREFANRRLRQLRRVGTFTIPAVLTDGTVSVDRDGLTATFNTTAQDAIAAVAEGTVGWYFQAGTSWYPVESYQAGVAYLQTPYGEASVTAGTFRLVKRYLTLPEPAAFLGAFGHQRLRRPLQRYTTAQLDAVQPYRQFSSAGPWYLAPTGREEDGKPIVEIYPYSLTAEQISYVYWAPARDFLLTDSLPINLNEHYLKEGMMIDVLRYQAMKAAEAGKVDLAGFFRNEYRAQETRWIEQYMPELARADGFPEDLALMFGSTAEMGDVVTARDEVRARGRRP